MKDKPPEYFTEADMLAGFVTVTVPDLLGKPREVRLAFPDWKAQVDIGRQLAKKWAVEPVLFSVLGRAFAKALRGLPATSILRVEDTALAMVLGHEAMGKMMGAVQKAEAKASTPENSAPGSTASPSVVPELDKGTLEAGPGSASNSPHESSTPSTPATGSNSSP